MEKITAPFTDEQVIALNKYQAESNFHPFTCGGGDNTKNCKRSAASNRRFHGENVEYNFENEGMLKATEEGWICPCGEYKQNWAHAFMIEPINNLKEHWQK